MLNSITDFVRLEVLYASLALLVLVLVVVVIRRLKNNKTNATEKSLFAKENFASKIKSLVKGQSDLEKFIPQLEEILLSADAGITVTESLIKKLQGAGAEHTGTACRAPTAAIDFLKSEITKILTPKTRFVIDKTKKPFVIYLVGVNGVGKTTTIGKLACQFKNQGLKTMLVAADTFRAAAVEQLKIWSERNEVSFVGGVTGADPSSVIVDGLRAGVAKSMDVILVDTAGRLQTKSNLMNELKKMTRMCEKEIGRNPDEIFLVVDAVTGQNGFSQAKIFFEAVPLTGVILTKYDATSKGGIIIAIAAETGLPIRYVGLGEGINDLKEFAAQSFVERLFS